MSKAMPDPKTFNVPKFSSFKPKPSEPAGRPEPKEEQEEGLKESRDARDSQRNRYRHRSRSRSRERQRNHRDEGASSNHHELKRSNREGPSSDRPDHHHRRRRSRSRSPPQKPLVRRHRSRSDEKKETPFLPKPAETSSTSFIIDRKGDPKNLTYGRVHRYDVPRFRRVGYGNVMGLPRRLRMERGVAEEADGIILVDSRQGVGKREKYAFARNEKKGTRLLRIKPIEEVGSEDELAGNGDFIPLSNSKRRKRRGSDSSMESDYEKKHFQLIEMPTGIESKPEDEDLEFATESDSDAEGRTIKVDEATRLKHVELSRQVDQDPTNLDAWLALINHQDAMLGLGEYAHRKITTAEIQSTAEIKISMYEKALKVAGSDLKNRERIWRGLMKEGAKVWSQSQQSQRWEKLTRQEVGSSLLWQSYINFRMSDFQDFTYDDVKELFQDRLRLLAQVKDKRIEKSGADDLGPLDFFHQQMVYVLVRATLFMREVGHTELSVAIWQAVLECNLSCHRDSDGAKKNDFDEFWDSDVPRIGEEGAKGWKEFTSIEMETAPEPRTDPEIPAALRKDPDVLAGWIKAERFRAAASRWPAKTCDETVEDDPYRVIMWTDIQDFAVDLGYLNNGRWEISAAAHRMLVDGFLVFCRLPPLVRAGWKTDSFVFDGILESSADHIRKEYLTSIAEPDEGLDALDAQRKANQPANQQNIFDGPAQNFVGGTDTLFSSPQWASLLKGWSSIYGSDPSAGPLAFSFVQRSLDTFARNYPTEELAEYYLAWMFLHQPSAVQKIAQSLIAKRPQSRRLYNTYALLLWNMGKREKAIGVWNQVLAMPDTPARTEKLNDILLWRSRIWCHLDDGDREMALRCLLSIPSGDATALKDIDTKSPVLLLRAKQHLSSTRDFLLGSGSSFLAALTAECLSLLYYLSPSSPNSRDIEGALGVIDHFNSSLSTYARTISTHHEATLQFSARLLWHHVNSGPFRPLLIRERMISALKLFPQNTIFMSLYAWNEARARIDDRVRGMLRDVALIGENDCVSSRLFAIRYEIQRGNQHSVKAAFEHAVASEACKGNAGLWRLYVLWCAGSGDGKVREGAKKVLYSGMRACPGVKPLMMEAFETLRGGMPDAEVRSVYEVTLEKEVRIHVDLEEWIEDLGGRKMG